MATLQDYGLDNESPTYSSWNIGDIHTITRVEFREGLYGEYPLFHTEEGFFATTSKIVLAQARKMAEIFEENDTLKFKVCMKERESTAGRTYQHLADI